MVGSIDKYFTCASACPSFSSGTGDSASCRSPGARRPFGRDCRRSWRLVVGILERNVFVGDFRAAGGGGASAVGIFGGGGMRFEVIAAAGTRAGACASRGSAFGPATEHAEITRDNFETGALLA